MLDIRLIRESSRITTYLYRKVTHTNQYLQCTSNHRVYQKLGIVRRHMHCTKTLIKDEERMKTDKEKVHVRVALKNCGYPEWPLKEGGKL